MPIKDKSIYPANWSTEIRPAILEGAQNRCEVCGVKNYQVGYREGSNFTPTCGNVTHDAAGRGELSYKDARELIKHCNECSDDKLIIIVLTIAHLDHNTTNNDYSNLKAMCQLHHLRHDLEHHKKNARVTRNNK